MRLLRPWAVMMYCGILAVALTQGCTHSGHGRDLRRAEHLPDRVILGDVPFFPQEAYQCGPAAMAMALGWTGLAVDPDDLVDEIYTPGRQGSLQAGLVAAARRRGRLAYGFRGAAHLLEELAAGHPAIVLQNLGTTSFPAWHYAVAVGIDRPADQALLHTGSTAWRPVTWSRLLFTWERSDYWALMVMPPGRIPASADENTYLEAVVGLEHAGQGDAAAKAYRAALKRWPHSWRAWIGLGNCRLAQGDLPAAEAAFREAVARAPDNGDAANNLAHVLARRGRLAEARFWARRAVARGGPNMPVYRETLGDIETRMTPVSGQTPQHTSRRGDAGRVLEVDPPASSALPGRNTP